jgi:hypothetical protein
VRQPDARPRDWPPAALPRSHRGVPTHPLPRVGGREREGGEAGGFGGGDAEQAQEGLGELVDGGLRDAFGVPLAVSRPAPVRNPRF